MSDEQSRSGKKPQPYQRHEDQGPTQLYVDAKPYEAAPDAASEEEKRRAAAETLKQNTTGSEGTS